MALTPEQVITSAEFHPTHCHNFVYSTSKGNVKLCDMRRNALCDAHAKCFADPLDPAQKSFFSEIISSISDCRFSPCGTFVAARDYLSVKIWDVRMEGKPMETYSVHPYLRGKLCDLYESDCIFDKFEVRWDGTSKCDARTNTLCSLMTPPPAYPLVLWGQAVVDWIVQ